MKKAKRTRSDEMRASYSREDFPKGLVRGKYACAFGTVWMMSYEEALREGTEVVTSIVDPFRESKPDLADSGLRAARSVAVDRYEQFCLFLAGKLIASGKARRHLQHVSEGAR